MINPSAQFDISLFKLKDCVFLNTFKRVNWNSLIFNLNNQNGDPVTTNPERWNLDTSEYSEIYKMWKDSNFNPSSIKWINYYPNKHYEQDFIKDIQSYLRLSGIHRSWISRVDPGYFAPWHWDIDDNEKIYLQNGIPTRYSIMISESFPGQIFIIGRDYIYDCPQGSIFKWNDYKEWHCGINASMVPKYMLHLLAY